MTDRQVLRRLLAFVRPYRAKLLLAVLCSVVSVAMSLLSPVLIGQAVDGMIAAGHVDFEAISAVLLRLAIVLAVGALFQWLVSNLTNIVTAGTVRDLRTAVFHRLLRVPLSLMDRTPHGQIIQRVVNDADAVGDGLLQGFTQLLSGSMTILGTMLFMFSMNAWIALAVVALTPLSMVIAEVIARGTHFTFLKQSNLQGEFGGFIEENVAGQKVLKLFGREAPTQDKLDEINARLYHWGYRAQIYPALTNPLTRFVNAMVYAAVGVIGTLFAVRGLLSVGRLTSFLSYAGQYTKPFNEVTGIMAQLQTAMASARRLMELLEQPIEQETEQKRMPDGHEIVLEDVSFRYVPDRPLIEHLNLTVRPGQRIAIVGPTGSGKTTLINLLMRYYDVTGGRILLGGVDLRDMDRDDLRACFGMVLQDTWLTQASVAENIAYGRPEATREEVVAAATAAYADGFISKLPQGYDTLLSEQGSNLSQGQKQLLCIARVMLQNPDMLILDEATSNIDTRTEWYVQQAFTKLMQGRTSFVVAHRLSTIREADVILVLRDGQVVEQGSHDELLARQGFYYQLYNSQFAGKEDEA